MTTYHPNIPQAQDDPSLSQLDLLDNFSKLNSDFSINHVPFTSGSFTGFHKLINFFGVQTTGGSISGLNSVLYTKIGDSGFAELFFKNANVTSQLTGLNLENSGNDYGIVTPWGFIMNFGKADFKSSGNAVTFEIPFNSTPFSVVATARDSNDTTGVKSVTTTGFDGFSDGTVSHYYFAIGI